MIRCDFFSTRRYLLILAVAAVAVGITLLVARERIERVYVHLELSHCLIYLNTDARSECAFGVIRTVLVTQGVSAAMDAFITTYRMLPAGSLGADCHNAVHRVGDMAYFNVYMNDPDLSNLAYPETTLICGAGFFHGFLNI